MGVGLGVGLGLGLGFGLGSGFPKAGSPFIFYNPQQGCSAIPHAFTTNVATLAGTRTQVASTLLKVTGGAAMAFMSSLCDCLRYAFGPVPDQCDCAEERRADAWHAYEAYRLRHLGRTGRLGFRKLAATSAQLAPLELPLLRQSVVEVAHRQSNLGNCLYTAP